MRQWNVHQYEIWKLWWVVCQPWYQQMIMEHFNLDLEMITQYITLCKNNYFFAESVKHSIRRCTVMDKWHAKEPIVRRICNLGFMGVFKGPKLLLCLIWSTVDFVRIHEDLWDSWGFTNEYIYMYGIIDLFKWPKQFCSVTYENLWGFKKDLQIILGFMGEGGYGSKAIWLCLVSSPAEFTNDLQRINKCVI